MSSRTLAALGLPTLLLSFGTLGCDGPKTGGEGATLDGGSLDGGSLDGGSLDGGSLDGGTFDGGGTGDGGTEEPDPISGEVQGTVWVQLYTENASDGSREYVAWEDSIFSEGFPFGAIFVGASNQVDGVEWFRGSDTIPTPSIEGDPYSLLVSLPEAGPVRLSATLDLFADGVLSTDEPFGIYPLEVEVTDGSSVADKDIVVLVDYDLAQAWWGWSDDGGGSGGGWGTDWGGGSGEGCEDPVTLAGNAVLGSPWAGGDVAVLVYDTDGVGPYAWVRDEPVVEKGVASLPFSLGGYCGSPESIRLLGAWDNNGNGLIDAEDLWGAYVTEPDVNGNPLVVGTESRSDLVVQVPLGDGRADISVVSFVRLSGEVLLNGGDSFDELPEGSVLYVAASMYRPVGDISIDSLERNSYDVRSFDASDFAGSTSLAYSLWSPGNTIVYLWGFVDHGPVPDEVVNTRDETVGAGGSEIGGRVSTGTSDQSGLDINLITSEPEK